MKAYRCGLGVAVIAFLSVIGKLIGKSAPELMGLEVELGMP